jgi:hypothetical protein
MRVQRFGASRFALRPHKQGLKKLKGWDAGKLGSQKALKFASFRAFKPSRFPAFKP